MSADGTPCSLDVSSQFSVLTGQPAGQRMGKVIDFLASGKMKSQVVFFFFLSTFLMGFFLNPKAKQWQMMMI